MTDALTSAPLWRRLAALLYDVFILVALSFGYGALATLAAVLLGTTEPGDYSPMFDGLLFPLGWIATITLFYCWFWHRSGQTLGMKTWKIRLTVDRSIPGHISRVPWHLCLLRCLVAPFLVLGLGIGYWYALVDPQGRSLQDKLSGTKTVSVLG